MASKNVFLKFGFISIALIFITGGVANSQSPHIMRSVLGSGGASLSVYRDGSGIVFPQSIGQFGVTGAFSKRDLEIRQGFIQPVKIIGASNGSENIKVNIYPNPFSSDVSVSFERKVTGKIEIKVIDLAGKPVYSGKNIPEGVIRIDLGFLNRGIYILRISGDNILTNYKIIKN